MVRQAPDLFCGRPMHVVTALFAVKGLRRIVAGVLRRLRRWSAAGRALDRDIAVQSGIARTIYLPHPALAEQGDDLVVTEFYAGSEGHLGDKAKFRRSGNAQVLNRGALGSSVDSSTG